VGTHFLKLFAATRVFSALVRAPLMQLHGALHEVEEIGPMKRALALAGFSLFALLGMDNNRVVIGPTGLAIVSGGQAMAADMARPAPPPVAAVGKGKAPIGNGKGKAPVVTARY
jgi:hypothetical protein